MTCATCSMALMWRSSPSHTLNAKAPVETPSGSLRFWFEVVKTCEAGGVEFEFVRAAGQHLEVVRVALDFPALP